MARYFEKISFSQFEKDFKNYENIKDLYDDIKLPIAKSVLAAGYDFISILDVIIKPGEVVKIPTGIKVCLNDDEFLGIYVRSSFTIMMVMRGIFGFVYKMRAIRNLLFERVMDLLKEFFKSFYLVIMIRD